tara:strand:- start:1835 stop:2263 length:429 start_codon:yes stop_codon:yes gene_type:complete
MNESTKVIPLGSTCFRQWKADSHCKYLHGYELSCKVWLRSSTGLDKRNWVFDFGGFKKIKSILEEYFDHKTCIAGDDPELKTFKKLDYYDIIQLRIFPDGVGIEKFAEFCHKTIDKNTPENIIIQKVEVYEHSKNSATYIKD